MIVIGVDPDEESYTAAAVEESSGLLRGGRTVKARRVGHEQLLVWARSLAGERLWALEDCRHVSIVLERFLLASGERERELPVAVLEGGSRESRLLLDRREDLVGERTRIRQRLRWHLHELEPELGIPAVALDRLVWLERVARRLARREQSVQVRICGGLVSRCRELSRRSRELERELAVRVAEEAPALLALPGCGVLTAAKLVGEIGGSDRFGNDARLAMHAGAAPLPASSGRGQRHRLNRSGNRRLNCALHRIAVTQGRVHPPARSYLARKEAEGKNRREALRCLKRHLARTVHRTLTASPPPKMTATPAPVLTPALT